MKNPWFALYVSDYLAKTCHLTQGQHGAYFLLMLHYYGTGKPIPANAMQVHSICRCKTDAEKQSCDEIIQLFFKEKSGVYRHKRIDQELARRSSISTKRRKSASKRWHANAMQKDTQSQSQVYTHTKSKESSSKSKSKPSFEEISSYCAERKNSIDPQKFLDYYTANGWKVGRNSMKDWRAAVRTWEKNGHSNGNGVATNGKHEEAISRVLTELYGPDDENAAGGVLKLSAK